MFTNKPWGALTEWERMAFTVRVIMETLGISEAKLEHTYLGDDTPFDSGLIDWKRAAEEFSKRKDKKKARGRKKSDKTTEGQGDTAGSTSDGV